MSPPFNPQIWTRQIPGKDSNAKDTYTISTDPSLLDLDALNAAFASDMVYWAKPMSREALELCVRQSLCFGLYFQGSSESGGERDGGKGERDGGKGREMVGFARLVTDYTTFAYLTDVYVLASHQGKGLGKWLMQCLDEVLGKWPDLRRCILFTRGAAAVKMYKDTIGARDIGQTTTGLVLMERPGGGNMLR